MNTNGQVITDSGKQLTDNQLVYLINQTPAYERIWKRLDADAKRKVLYLAEGTSDLLDLILEDAEEDLKEGGH